MDGKRFLTGFILEGKKKRRNQKCLKRFPVHAIVGGGGVEGEHVLWKQDDMN